MGSKSGKAPKDTAAKAFQTCTMQRKKQDYDILLSHESHESQHKSQITAAQSQGSGAQLAGSPNPLRHRHVAHHSSDQKIADLSPMKLA